MPQGTDKKPQIGHRLFRQRVVRSRSGCARGRGGPAVPGPGRQGLESQERRGALAGAEQALPQPVARRAVLRVEPRERSGVAPVGGPVLRASVQRHQRDRKSTRLNSSHLVISYAVFCLKKKKKYYT